MKRFYVQNIGRARHVVCFYDGQKAHPDGSPFWDCFVCGNKRNLARKVRDLLKEGYIEV